MNDGEFNDISRAIGSLEAGLRAHDIRTSERHQENLMALAEVRAEVEELKQWRWSIHGKITAVASGVGAAAGVAAPWIKKLLGMAQ